MGSRKIPNKSRQSAVIKATKFQEKTYN